MEIKPPDKAPRKTYKPKPGSRNAEIKQIYSSIQWKNLRKSYRMQHPLCERCLANGIYTPATDIHHIVPISRAKDELTMWNFALNANNLMALCKECHCQIHKDLKDE